MRNTTLHMATEEQRNADENVLMLVEEHKREKEVALKERHLGEKQKLAMEIEELKRKLDVVKQMDDDEWVVQKKKEQRNKEVALKKVLEIESCLDEKQKLDMEIEELLGELEVMKHMGDDEYDDGRVDQMDGLLQENDDELHALEDLHNHLRTTERLRIWDSTH